MEGILIERGDWVIAGKTKESCCHVRVVCVCVVFALPSLVFKCSLLN